MKKPPRSPQDYPFEPIEDAPPPRDHLELENLRDVKLSLRADLGRRRMAVQEILELRVGSIVQLDKMAGEAADIYVNDQPLAKGEVVVIGDSLHVRISEIIGTAEKPEDDEA